MPQSWDLDTHIKGELRDDTLLAIVVYTSDIWA